MGVNTLQCPKLTYQMIHNVSKVTRDGNELQWDRNS